MVELKKSPAYRQLAILAEGFFGAPVAEIESLKGDGSDRCIYRIRPRSVSTDTLVGVVHDNVVENRNFFRVTHAFHQAGLAAPAIHGVSDDETVYLMQDLGTDTLADKVTAWQAEGRDEQVLTAYRQVLSCLVRIQNDLPPLLDRFLDQRHMNLPVYEADLTYFKRDYVQRFGLDAMLTPAVLEELRDIVRHYLAVSGMNCFVYRDFQARNIMWLNEQPWFIDYQSAFLGPCHYDLASLLFGSKSGLDMSAREELIDCYCRIQPSAATADRERFRQVFFLFVVVRRLRSLGTYGFLSSSKGKTGFFKNIGPTLDELTGLFRSQTLLSPFPRVKRMIEDLRDVWKQKEASIRSGIADQADL